ncbi:MAG: SH3 domain-containing protein [Clostridia bacterium]|nr:SH3 domain-containing protein [Clostridia bacterium]
MKSVLRRFCAAAMIVMLLIASVAVAETYPLGTYYCNGNRVNVRSGPSSSYPSQYKLMRGDVVTATSQSNGWMKITYFNKSSNSSETGYIYRKYLYQVETTSAAVSGSVYKTTANLRVRSQASTSKGYVITKLKKGTKVKVSKKKGSWVYITYSGGTGWVSAKYLKKVV